MIEALIYMAAFAAGLAFGGWLNSRRKQKQEPPWYGNTPRLD